MTQSSAHRPRRTFWSAGPLSLVAEGVVLLAVVRTLLEPLLRDVSARELSVYLTCALIGVVAMGAMSALSRRGAYRAILFIGVAIVVTYVAAKFLFLM